MLRAGIIIGTDDSLMLVRPRNRGEFSLEELQELVGGFIKLHSITRTDLNGTLVVNENCPWHRQKTLSRNRRATALAVLPPGEDIRGDAMLVVECPPDAASEALMVRLVRGITDAVTTDSTRYGFSCA